MLKVKFWPFFYTSCKHLQGPWGSLNHILRAAGTETSPLKLTISASSPVQRKVSKTKPGWTRIRRESGEHEQDFSGSASLSSAIFILHRHIDQCPSSELLQVYVGFTVQLMKLLPVQRREEGHTHLNSVSHIFTFLLISPHSLPGCKIHDSGLFEGEAGLHLSLQSTQLLTSNGTIWHHFPAG